MNAEEYRRRYGLEPLDERARLIWHLGMHPGHAQRDYQYWLHRWRNRPVQDIRREHEQLHQGLDMPGVAHLHEQGLKVPGEPGYDREAEGMAKDGVKSLDLKVTVEGWGGEDPDERLAKMTASGASVQLAGAFHTVKVTKVERADGQPFGLEAEFSRYWDDSHGTLREGTDWNAGEKLEAYDAFLYGVKYGRNTSGK